MPFLLDRSRTSDNVNGSLRAMLAMSNSQDKDDQGAKGSTITLHQPAAAANFRLNLMKSGNLSDDEFQSISTSTLLICSAQDRLLASLQEGWPTVA